jgi:hypothetical protein
MTKASRRMKVKNIVPIWKRANSLPKVNKHAGQGFNLRNNRSTEKGGVGKCLYFTGTEIPWY